MVDAIVWSDSPVSLKKFTDGSKHTKDLRIKGSLAHGSELAVRATPEALEAALSADPGLSAYPDMVVHALDSTSNDAIGAPQIWNRTDPTSRPVVGTGITVAVIDTGICYTHPDLGGGFGSGYKVIGGYDFYNNDADPMDDNGHGTHVAGIIAADGGSHGVAPGATLLAYKVLGPDGSGSMSIVVQAVDAAIDPNDDGDTSDHADIISMSLGGSGDPTDPICRAVERAVAAGILVVVAAGNSGPSVGSVASPGLSPYALTVGAANDLGVLANFSSRGPTDDMRIKPEISAPGVSVLSTVPYANARRSSSSGYMEMSGTSMATPHVSGAAALVMQLHPTWTQDHVKAALISGAKLMDESVWSAGSGMLSLPGSADVSQYSPTPLISYGVANGTVSTVSVTNAAAGATFSVSAEDRYSLSADGSMKYHDWTNLSVVSPLSVTIPASGSGQLTMTINPDTQPEGYYDGSITLRSGAMTYRIPFGFLILTKVTIHVLDTSGREVLDPYGGVWVYSLPDAATAIGQRGSDEPAPPATFLLPSGDYRVHAIGHQLVYKPGSPYILSDVFTLARLETRDFYLRMNDAHVVTIDLETNEGIPIYVKEYRAYARYAGTDIQNISFDLTGTDYSIKGSSIFTIPHSINVYMSDTNARVGIAVTGYSYTSAMWDFMKLNWQHWYEYISTNLTNFLIESTTDLQFMLAWEFPEVNGSLPSVLTYDLGTSAVIKTKYDIPGKVYEPWCNWGTHRAIGGESVFYMRRDTETSINPFFSGITRTSIVNGVFAELYFPRGIFQGFIEREFYRADYSQLLRARTASEIYVPNRNFLTELDPVQGEQRLGQGPFYPSVYTANTNDSLILFQPLLRDQYGSKVDGMSTPMMRLYRDGFSIGVYQISEFQARPDAKRIVALMGPGEYAAKFEYSPFSQLYNDVWIELGFTVPGQDIDPPVITGMSLPQRFSPGSQLELSVAASDNESSPVSVTMSSRPGSLGVWTPLTVSTVSPGIFASAIQTTASTSVIDVKIRVTDASGNYLEYIAHNASWAETPVQFDIRPVIDQVEYKTTGVLVGLTGYLRNATGGSLHLTAAIPLELSVGGEKIGIVLDEYMSSGAHQHNGTIRFDWTLRPTEIFTAPGQVATVTVDFDLGTYQRVTRSFTLTSIPNDNTAPTIELVSPANDTDIASGTSIDLSIIDDGTFTAGYSVDGTAFVQLSAPYDISTSSFSDGTHSIAVYAQDDEGVNTTLGLRFDVDANSPQLAITSPANGTIVPLGSTMTISVSDRHLSLVTYHLDSGADIIINSPYTVSMDSWSVGTHTVQVRATDSVGHTSTVSSTFEIASSTVTVSLSTPANGSVVKSGVPIVLTVLGSGTLACEWSEGGIPHTLASPFVIATAGWSEGLHLMTATASNSLGGEYSISFTMIIDNTAPTITLVSPEQGAYVDQMDVVMIRAEDPHHLSISWDIWGLAYETDKTTAVVLLTRVDQEGMFVVRVSAVDQANNSASADFVFMMDIASPYIEFGGIGSGLVASGAPLNVSATDTNLAVFQFAIDGAPAEVVTSPHQIDTSSLAPGLHDLWAYAIDRAGHSTSDTPSIYIDATAPVVQILAEGRYVNGSWMDIDASVTDDFGVSAVTLFFTAKDGSLQSVQMSLSEGTYTVTLSPSQLWDGIVVYAVATDLVGHSSESSHVKITSEGMIDDGGGSSLISSPAGLVGLLAVVVALLAIPIIGYLILRRRKDSWESLEEDLPEEELPLRREHEEEPAEEKEPLLMPLKPFEELSVGPRPMVASGISRPVVETRRSVISEPLSAPAPTPPPIPVPPPREPIRLIDAIPDSRFESEEDEDEYQAFMHELEDVQDQMRSLSEKRSVYKQPEEHLRPDLELDSELDDKRPKRITGLQLKKSME